MGLSKEENSWLLVLREIAYKALVFESYGENEYHWVQTMNTNKCRIMRAAESRMIPLPVYGCIRNSQFDLCDCYNQTL